MVLGAGGMDGVGRVVALGVGGMDGVARVAQKVVCWPSFTVTVVRWPSAVFVTSVMPLRGSSWARGAPYCPGVGRHVVVDTFWRGSDRSAGSLGASVVGGRRVGALGGAVAGLVFVLACVVAVIVLGVAVVVAVVVVVEVVLVPSGVVVVTCLPLVPGGVRAGRLAGLARGGVRS